MKLRLNKILVVWWILLCDNVLAIFTPIVKTKYGKLRGLRSVSGQNRYYGIPYAASQRFQPPKPPIKWSGVLDAVDRFGSCSQTVAFLETGSEDCLRLDVFAPETAAAGNRLPVLVWIHGGGYYYGSKWHYDPEYLVTKDVIVVTVNYRLGVFGFLCIDGISNLGLKDQVAALKWIRKNIASFGGDPDNVTISGQSAGASAAAMHMLSKSSAGLFHKLILFSGSPLTPWAFNVEHEASALGDAIKIRNITSDESVLDTFSTATTKELFDATRDTSINPRHFKYAPCIDTNFTAAFFHDTPYGAITSGNFNKVPIISGSTSAEGMLFYGLHDDKTLREWDEEFAEKLPAIFSWCPANRVVIAARLRDHYFGGRISKATVTGIVNFYSDWLSFATEDAFSDLLAKYSDKPLYRYVFDYEGGRNFAKSIFYRKHGVGASHSDDIFYVFKPAGLPLPVSGPDKLFIGRLTAMLTNFMKFGEPTPEGSRLSPRWPAYTAARPRALRLASPPAVLAAGGARGRLFRDLLCEFGQRGYVPCDTRASCTTP